jgi:hypothetical protein
MPGCPSTRSVTVLSSLGITNLRIQALLPDRLPPPLTPDELVSLLLQPKALAMPEEEDTFILQMMRGFAAPEATWVRFLLVTVPLLMFLDLDSHRSQPSL